MSSCPHHNSVRADLPPLTPRIAALPVDARGIPVPFFVAWIDGKPEFRLADPKKWAACHNDRLCWTCGQPLGKFVTFVIGPMCSVTRTTSEPPNHLDCAMRSVQGCPFLSKPQMTRRQGGAVEENKGNVAGEMIERNPGVTCLWTTETTSARPRGYEVFRDPQGRPLIEVPSPVSVSWWREGRPATHDEVLASINSGLPLLERMCELEPLAAQRDEAHAMLRDKTRAALQYLPPKNVIVTL